MNLLRKLILSLVTILCVNVTAQIPTIYLEKSNITKNIKDTSILKGDTVDMVVMYKEEMSYTRTLYFDFQYNYKNFTILSVTDFGANVEGSALPSGAIMNIQNNFHPGYTYARTAQNTTTNGTQNYYNANYNYSSTSSNAIQRIYTTVTSDNNLRDGKYIKIRLKVNATTAGTSYDSLYMNFVSGWRSDGAGIQTYMPLPKSTFITLDANANTLVTGNIYKNPSAQTTIKFTDSASGVSTLLYPDVNGSFKASTELASNRTYKVSVLVDSIAKVAKNAITVSDATAALNEFGSVNLDGTFNKTNLKTGAAWVAADANYNGSFDAADPYLILAHVAGTLPMIPNVYTYRRADFSKDTLPVQDFIYFRSTTANQVLDLNYLIVGDINRSHSSQIVATDGTIKSFSLVNTPVPKKAVAVSLSNAVVESDNISIPVSINTDGLSICGLQFEFSYDATKIQLQEIKSNTNPSWLNFYTNENGYVKFGGIDKTLKEPISGTSIPFTIKFKSLVPGTDINTYIWVTDNMDASDNRGNQVGISLNTAQIRLIGINNFK
jgi:hypothetical protein